MTPEIVIDGLLFPECPRWHDHALYFSDMHGGIVWQIDANGVAEKILEVSTRPAGIGWLPDGTLQVVSMLDERVLRQTAGGLTQVASLKSFGAQIANDMVIDREGRAYIGNFGFDLNAGEGPRPTVLLSVERDGKVRVVAEDLLFPNGAVITADGATLIVAETFANRLTEFAIQPDGSLTARRVFADLGGLYPDGICLDAEGCIWVACPGSQKIVRVRPGGTIADEIALPGRESFACMLGGNDGRDLYICTAKTFDPSLTKEQRAGRIERVRVNAAGAGLP